MNAAESLRQAIAAVRAEALVVVKTARNTGLNSDYASYADVWATLKPLLTQRKLAVGFVSGTTSREGDTSWKQVLTLECSSTETGETISHSFETLFPEGNRGVNLTQRQGMAQTYGKRYALINFFHLITGDDDDAQRLGMDRIGESAAPAPSQGQHWSTLCCVSLFGVGQDETMNAWHMIGDPSDQTGERSLGDNEPGMLAKLAQRYPDHAGLIAWRAELVGERAALKGCTSWDDILKQYPQFQLPPSFAECRGVQLANLALALKN